MYSEPVVYVDIETTGGSAQKAKIIEIGAIRVEDSIVTDEFKTFVNPGAPIPYWTTNITGINDADVVQAPFFEEIAYQLDSILKDAVFIAHNVRFDYSFIKFQLESCGYKFRPKMLCTVRLSRALYPEARGHSLEKIIQRHGIGVAARHRAYDDAKAIKDFAELAFNERGAESFQAAVLLQNRNQTLPPNLKHDISKVSNSPGVYVYEDEAGRPLYVGKSKNLKQRLASHFTSDIASLKEMKLSQSVHMIKTIETSSELEALLLESKMVKELLPLHNRQLRRQRELTIVTKGHDEQGYINLLTETVRELSPERLADVYGVYTSRGKARTALENKCRTFSLCPKLLGLEKSKRACFLSQLGKCHGACSQVEPAESYNERLEIAMERSRIDAWPFAGPVTITESDISRIVVDKWVIIKRIYKNSKIQKLPPVFDLDNYKILRSYLLSNPGSVIPMSSRA